MESLPSSKAVADRAEKCRIVANCYADTEKRAQMLALAKDYERIAEELAKFELKPSPNQTQPAV